MVMDTCAGQKTGFSSTSAEHYKPQTLAIAAAQASTTVSYPLMQVSIEHRTMSSRFAYKFSSVPYSRMSPVAFLRPIDLTPGMLSAVSPATCDRDSEIAYTGASTSHNSELDLTTM